MSHSDDDCSTENNIELHVSEFVSVEEESDSLPESNSVDDVPHDSVDRINECQGAVRSDVDVSAERGSDRQNQRHSRDDAPVENTREGQTKGHSEDDEGKKTTTVDDKARHLRKKINVYFNTVGKTGQFYLHPFVIFKYAIQILKMIFVTHQIMQFGQIRNEFHYVVNRGHIALRNLLLENWDASCETAHGEFASYDIDDLSKRINQSVYKYYHIENLTLGTFSRVEGKMMNATLELYHFDSGFGTEKVTFPVLGGEFDFIETLKNRSHNNARTRMATLTLNFALQAVRAMDGDNTPILEPNGRYTGEITAICISTEGKIFFENKANGGQVIINMNTTSKRVKCQEKQDNETGLGFTNKRDWAVVGLVLSLISLITTIILASAGMSIYWKTKQFMKKNFRAFYKPANPKKETDLPCKEYLHFFRYWFGIIFLGDVLMFYSAVILVNRVEEYDLGQLDKLAVILGTCIIFQYCSILPLLVSYPKLAMLLRTIYKAFANVIKYVSCALVIFYGFAVCGLLVLGPYHPKFRTLPMAAETLFAVMQGNNILDDVQTLDIVTYGLLWHFTRLYLYACIGLFYLVVYNIILAIVIDTYDSLKNYEKEKNTRGGSLENAMLRFLSTSNDSPLRNAIIQFMSTNSANSADEQLLLEYFRKFYRVTDDDINIERVTPRTIQAFLDQADEDKGKSCDWFGIKWVYGFWMFFSIFRDQ